MLARHYLLCTPKKTGSHTYEMFPEYAIHPCLLKNNYNCTKKN